MLRPVVAPVRRVGPPTGVPTGLVTGRRTTGAGRTASGPAVVGVTGLSAVTGAASTGQPGLDPTGGALVPAVVGEAVARAAGKAALPVGLLTVMAAFLAVQARLDRRDPKLLAGGSAEDDYLVFRPWTPTALPPVPS